MNDALSRATQRIAELAGHRTAPVVSLIVLVIWTKIAPSTEIANYIISLYTVLMLHVLQYSQNKGDTAEQLKLDELIRVTNARNELRRLESQSDEIIQQERKKEV
jgi:low affinity Fe/Cu permease